MPSDIPHTPTPHTAERDRAGIADLFGNAIGQISTLFRQEIRLARAEMGEKLGSVTGAITPIAAGGALLLGALIILLFALVSLLMSFGMAEGYAELIVGLFAALAGYGLVRSGIAHLKASNLVPERTTTQLSRDAQVAKEQVR